MQILLPPVVNKRLQRELLRAGDREIGGLLFGEQVGNEVFRVVDITVQRAGGSCAAFTRDPRRHETQLREFFRRTGKNYTRFNYLGEWHSHPSFAPVPSSTDVQTMQSLVSDPSAGVNFLVLLICKQATKEGIEATAAVFHARLKPIKVPIHFEAEKQSGQSTLAHYVLRFFGF
jgi:integrative and conjugative element protein (TIGR02256 family)